MQAQTGRRVIQRMSSQPIQRANLPGPRHDRRCPSAALEGLLLAGAPTHAHAARMDAQPDVRAQGAQAQDDTRQAPASGQSKVSAVNTSDSMQVTAMRCTATMARIPKAMVAVPTESLVGMGGIGTRDYASQLTGLINSSHYRLLARRTDGPGSAAGWVCNQLSFVEVAC